MKSGHGKSNVNGNSWPNSLTSEPKREPTDQNDRRNCEEIELQRQRSRRRQADRGAEQHAGGNQRDGFVDVNAHHLQRG